MYAVDYETFYDPAVHYSLKNMGPVAYCRHSLFDCYLVSIVGKEGVIYAGHPTGFNWESLRGELLLAHNASFDGAVLRRLQELKIVPQGIGDKWVCTADLAVYFQAPRDLRGAAQQLLGMEVSKEYRKKAKGKKGAQLSTDPEILKAGAGDALACYAIAEKYLDQWPAVEQRLSELNRESGWYGVQIDVAAVEEAMGTIANLRQDALRLMVWADDAEDTPLSPVKIREHGRKMGVPVPASLDAKNPDYIKWLAEYGPQHPWIVAMRDYRRLNTVYKKLKVIRDEPDENGIYSFSKKYYGAAGTGRFSGAGGFNMENLPVLPLYGVEFRSKIKARPGYKFLCPDYSQIEARLLPWRVGDTKFLAAIADVGNVYVAYGLDKGITTDRKMNVNDKPLYKRTKEKVLSLGYAMGHKKYRGKAALAGIELTEQESKDDVYGYRQDNPKTVGFWRHHNDWLKVSIARGDAEHTIRLKSGRLIRYFDPILLKTKKEDGTEWIEMKARVVRGREHEYFYGGKMVENEIQATARDILRDAWVALADALEPLGCKVLFTVHDEFVVEIPDALCTDEMKTLIHNIMVGSSPWSAGCPHSTNIAAGEAEYTDCYGK